MFILSIYCQNLRKLRFVIEYKHVRFKVTSKLSWDLSKEEKMQLKDLHKKRSEMLREILNCNIHTAREIISKNKDVVNINYQDFYINAKFCSKFLKLSDLIECPWVLTLQPGLFQHRYYSLEELGFSSVTPHFILRFPFIMKETPRSLKEKGFPVDFQHRSDILTKYLDTSKRTEINNKLLYMYYDGSNLKKIKAAMNAEFFSAKLECSIGKAHQMFQSYGALRVQSIYNTNNLLNLLLWRIGFSLSKIFTSPNLLAIHHETVENFVSEIPEILGVSALFIAKRVPFILKLHIDSIRRIEAILKEFNVTKDQLICCPKVFLIAPDTLYKRLNIVCNTEEFAVLHSSKKFLWLVYYFKNLNSRLKYIKEENLPCSINMFTATKSTFDKYITFNNTRTSITEAYAYLADVFKLTEKEINKRVHCYSSDRIDVQNISAFNCKNVIEFLLLSGITKKQIFNGLEIVFYEIDTVKDHFKSLPHHHACQPFEEWVSHPNLIQLLIYSIEVVDYHSYKIECDEQDHLLAHSSF